jgi:hypothetical protein
MTGLHANKKIAVEIVLKKINTMSKTTPHSISLSEAIELTSRFRTNRTPDLALSETFDKNSVLAMLSVPNSAQLRIYLGEKVNGDICSVLVAADAEGNDLLPPLSSSLDGEDDDTLILEDAIRCPQLCPPPSPLNE